jgi:hypothetical protein
MQEMCVQYFATAVDGIDAMVVERGRQPARDHRVSVKNTYGMTTLDRAEQVWYDVTSKSGAQLAGYPVHAEKSFRLQRSSC